MHEGTVQGPKVFDPASYPRTYRTSRKNATSNLVVAGLMAVAGLAGAWFFGAIAPPDNRSGMVLVEVICLSVVALAAAMVSYTRDYRIVLSADSIEVRSWWRTKAMRRADIAGWRAQQTRKRSMVYLEAKTGSPRMLAVATSVEMDEPFKAWFDSLPNLDKLEYERSQAEIAADVTLGATEAERLKKLKNARSVAGALYVIALAAFMWGCIRPTPYLYAIATLAFLPLVPIGISLRYPHLFKLSTQRGNARPSLLGPVALPAMVLALRAWFDIPMFEHAMVVGGGLVVGVALMGILASFNPEFREQKRAAIGMALALCAYAYGALMFANAIFDHGPVQPTVATVRSKHIISGKSRSYELDLTSVGAETDPTVQVSRQFYDSTNVGGMVCVYLRPGALGMPWYRVRDCGARGP